MTRQLIICLVFTCLVFFFALPLSVIAYATAGGVAGGLAIIFGLAVLQIPLFAILRRLGVLPSTTPPSRKSAMK